MGNYHTSYGSSDYTVQTHELKLKVRSLDKIKLIKLIIIARAAHTKTVGVISSDWAWNWNLNSDRGGEILDALHSPHQGKACPSVLPKIYPSQVCSAIFSMISKIRPSQRDSYPTVLPKTYPSQVWSAICTMTCKICPSQRDSNPVRSFPDGWGEYMASTFSPLPNYAQKLPYLPNLKKSIRPSHIIPPCENC